MNHLPPDIASGSQDFGAKGPNAGMESEDY